MTSNITYTAMAEMNLRDRHISKQDVLAAMAGSAANVNKGRTIEIRHTTADGREIVVRIARDNGPTKVVAVIVLS